MRKFISVIVCVKVCRVGEGVTKVVLHPHDPLVYASTLDGAVRCLDLRSGTSVAEYTGGSCTVRLVE